MAEWYYVTAGQPTGPLAEAALQEMLRTGSLSSETPVWQPGMAAWTPARDLSIFSAPPASAADYVIAPVTTKTWNPTRASAPAQPASTPPAPTRVENLAARGSTPTSVSANAPATKKKSAAPAAKTSKSEIVFRTPYRVSALYTIFIVALMVVWWFIMEDFLHSKKILLIDGVSIGHEGGSVFFVVGFVVLIITALTTSLQCLRGILFPSRVEFTRDELRIPHSFLPGSKRIPLSSIQQITEIQRRRRRLTRIGGARITYLHTGKGRYHFNSKKFPKPGAYDQVRQMLISPARRQTNPTFRG